MSKRLFLLLCIAATLVACSTTPQPATVVIEFPENPRGGKEPMDGDYWAHRYTYPTGKFDNRWVKEARIQHDNMRVAQPAGIHLIAAPGKSGDGFQGAGNLPTDQFTSLGPRPLSGQFGIAAGRVNAIVTHPADDTIAYLGSDGGGVWKTENCCDSNTTWTSLNDDPMFNSIAIGDLFMDPNNPDIVYAGTGDLRYGSYSFGSSGLLRTKDAGDTWEILGEDVFNPIYAQPPGQFPQYQAIGKVRVDPNDSETILVGAKNGIFFSYDDGANWTGPCTTNSFSTQRQDTTALELIDDGGGTTVILAGIGTRGAPTPVQPDLSENGANGVYKGTVPASGCPTDWTLVSSGWPTGTGGGVPYPDNIVGRVELAVAASNTDIVYAEIIHADTLTSIGVWRSDNQGDTWTQSATASNFSGCSGLQGQAWYDAGITVDPNDPDVIFLSDIDVFRSSNGGDSFTNMTCGYSSGARFGDDVHVDQHARTFVNGDSSRLLIGNDGGVYYSGNADAADPRDIAFTQLNDTLNTIEFYSGDITGNFNTSPNPGVIGGAQDNGTSRTIFSGPPSPQQWVTVWGGDGIYARIEPVNQLRWYAESQNGNMGISQTGGAPGTYNGVSEPWNGDRRGFLFPFEIYKHDCPGPDGCEHLIAGSYRVWETINGGISGSDWYANSPDLTKGTLAGRSIINQLEFGINDESVVIVGTNDGNVQYGFNMGTGVANSGAWVDVTGGNAILPNRPILDVFTDPLTATIGYAAVGGFDDNTPAQPGHVFQVTCNSDCSSFTWANKSGDLPNIPVDSIAVNPKNRKQVFAGTDWGLYFTDDIDAASPSWSKFSAGLPSVMIWDMAIDRGFTTLALFTRSRGAFVWPLPDPGLDFINGFENPDP